MQFPENEFGARVQRRLRDDHVIWLTTVRSDGTPEPNPVWFLWDGTSFLIYTQPSTQRLRHIAGNPKVALNLNANDDGSNVVIFAGEARIVSDEQPANDVPAYVAKYRSGFTSLGLTAEEFAHTYSVPIRVTPTNVRGR